MEIGIRSYPSSQQSWIPSADSRGYTSTHRTTCQLKPQRLTYHVVQSTEAGHLFPVHPRTRSRMAELERELQLAAANSQLWLMGPVGYLNMLVLLANARVVLTDSGGMQKESFFLQVPCMTFREGTE